MIKVWWLGWMGMALLAASLRADDPAPVVTAGDAPAAQLTSREKATQAVKLPPGFTYEILVMGDIPEPVYLQFCPDGRLWFTGRRGHIWAYDFASRRADLIAQLNVCWQPIPGRESNERGLHGIEFDPGFLTNGFLYVHYAPFVPTNGVAWTNRVSRFTADLPRHATALRPGSERVLLEIPSIRGFHQGGALAYNPRDRKLYVTVGDNNVSTDTKDFFNDPKIPPQALDDLRGKTLRLNLDGSVPSDNPFVNRPGANPVIYTYGHRNPYSLHVDALMGNVYVGEVGYDRTNDCEEINWLRPGGNYGWPLCIGPNLGVHGGDCPLPDAVKPWIFWTRNTGANATVGPIYRPAGRGSDFPGPYHGGMFYADWVRKWIRFATVNPSDNTVVKTEPWAAGFNAGVLAMQLGPDGALYLAEYGGWFTGAPSDKISRITHTGAAASK